MTARIHVHMYAQSCTYIHMYINIYIYIDIIQTCAYTIHIDSSLNINILICPHMQICKPLNYQMAGMVHLGESPDQGHYLAVLVAGILMCDTLLMIGMKPRELKVTFLINRCCHDVYFASMPAVGDSCSVEGHTCRERHFWRMCTIAQLQPGIKCLSSTSLAEARLLQWRK